MAKRTSFSLDGAKELNEALKRLGAETATKTGATAARKAAHVMRDAARADAPRGEQPTRRTWRNKSGAQQEADYGRLHENIATRKRRSKKAHTIQYVVTTGNAFWGRFSEFGTENEPARPWFGPAVERVAGEVVDAISKELKKGIDRAIRKAARK